MQNKWTKRSKFLALKNLLLTLKILQKNLEANSQMYLIRTKHDAPAVKCGPGFDFFFVIFHKMSSTFFVALQTDSLENQVI